MPAFPFPAEASTQRKEGWKAELALGGWLVTYRNKYWELNLVTFAHLSTNSSNRARHRLTLLKAFT